MITSIDTLDRHVIKFLGWSIANDAAAHTVPAIVLKFAKHGSLRSIVNKKLEGAISISDEQKVTWSYQIADALAYMHGRDLIHRDIKPANVLVGDKRDIKVVSDSARP